MKKKQTKSVTSEQHVYHSYTGSKIFILIFLFQWESKDNWCINVFKITFTGWRVKSVFKLSLTCWIYFSVTVWFCVYFLPMRLTICISKSLQNCSGFVSLFYFLFHKWLYCLCVHRFYVFNNGSLYFPNIQPEDEGTYRCEGLSEHHPKQAFTAEIELACMCTY